MGFAHPNPNPLSDVGVKCFGHLGLFSMLIGVILSLFMGRVTSDRWLSWTLD